MKRPDYRRTKARPGVIGPVPQGVDLVALARRVRYIGSPEHKDAPSFAGMQRPRAGASICPLEISRNVEVVQHWLERAVEAGRGEWLSDTGNGDTLFPRYVWHREDNVVYEARLTNPTTGEYKGYPITRDEWPKGLERLP